MTINAIAGSSTLTQPIVGLNQQTAADSTQNQGVQASRSHRHHGGGMVQALMQTLNQLGLASADQFALTGQDAAQTTTATDQGGSGTQTSSVQSDLSNFMHALFQAVGAQGASGTGSTSTGSSGSNFESGLSSLITQLTNSSGSGSSQTSNLQSAFSTLVQALQDNSSSGSGTSVTLQSFLTALQQNLMNQQPGSATGNMVSTQA